MITKSQHTTIRRKYFHRNNHRNFILWKALHTSENKVPQKQFKLALHVFVITQTYAEQIIIIRNNKKVPATIVLFDVSVHTFFFFFFYTHSESMLL